MIATKFKAFLLAGVAAIALSGSAHAETTTDSGAPKKAHRHSSQDRFDILEQQIQQQAVALKQQNDEIQSLKAQLGQPPASPPVSAAQFAALQNKVDEQAKAPKSDATVTFKPQTPYQRQRSVPTLTSADGKWTFSPYAMVQGDWASYSKGQPLSVAGTNNLKSSGENFRRARIGFTGTFDKDFGYTFIYDFGGAGGDETYQGFAAAGSGTTTTSGGKSISPYTASTGAGTGPHIYKALVSYKGILDPFTFEAGLMPPPANLGDATQSDDLLFAERPSPSQLSRGLDGDDAREAAGFIGNGSIWNASLFLSGDTYGKAALIAPATTYGGSQEAVVGRVAIAPIQHPDFVIHLGANAGYVIHPAEATSTASPGVTTYPITFSDRPELRVDNATFLNTGAINAKSAFTAGLEAAAAYGPVLIQGEDFWYGIERNNAPSGVSNPNFSGWYVEGTVSLTGDPHPYSMANASFTRPSPHEPFDPANGQWGAWELAGRYSSSDLDYDISSATLANRVFGGEQNIWSAGVNFYPNDVLRFMFDWQNVNLKNIGALNDNGSYQTFEVRTQVSF